MKTIIKVFALFVVFSLASCAEDTNEIAPNANPDNSTMEVGNNGDDDDIDCKGNCDEDD